MSKTDLETRVPAGLGRALTAVSPELEWFANLPNARTRKPKRQR